MGSGNSSIRTRSGTALVVVSTRIRSFAGPDAWVEYLREVQAPWDRFEVVIEELLEAGDMFVALLRERAHARRGDLDVENETAAIIKVRGGKIVEARGYLDREEALKAAGLTE